MVALRREIHAHPELAFEEHATAGLLSGRFADLGLKVRTGVGGSGVIADLDGGQPGPCVLIRAELDALPVEEATGLPFAADWDVAHLCGHDAHLAALIGVATVLAPRREGLRGSIRFCLQPAEELLAGAVRLLADGVLDGVDAVLGAHVLAQLPYGTVAVNVGTILSGASFFRVVVSGSAGHAGTASQYADAVLAAAHITTALQALPARETPTGEVLILGIGSIQAGRAANAAPEEVTLLGGLRWFNEAIGERGRRRVAEITSGVAAALGCSATIKWTGGAPVLSNDPAWARATRESLEADGLAIVVHIPPLTASDDFAEWSSRVPGLYIGVGCGGIGSAPHHHPLFSIDERAILLTARSLCRAALALVPQAADAQP
jgi:amidohydrolase